MTIKINIAEKRATVEGEAVIICGNEYTAEFSFDDEWNGENAKIARFVWAQDGQLVHEDREIVGNIAQVPQLSGVHSVSVGVLAGDTKATTPVCIPCKFPDRVCGQETEGAA